jgi:predicted RNase H-like HicB family nuclease
MSAVHYDSYTDARAHLKDLLDAAEKGQVATVRRDSARTAVVDVERWRHFLASLIPSRAEVVSEAGGWSVFISGLPVAADGATFDEAVTEMIDALREYADDWQERLLDSPNHRENWAWFNSSASAATSSCTTGSSGPPGELAPAGDRDGRSPHLAQWLAELDQSRGISAA